MRQVRNVLKLKYEHKLTHRQIARSCAIGNGTVSDCVARASAAGLGWPLPEELDDAALDRLLYAKALRTAKLFLRDRPTTPGASKTHPYYWAAFALTGAD